MSAPLAFPAPIHQACSDASGWDMGMSQREWIAGHVLAGFCANPNLMSNLLLEEIAGGIRGGNNLVSGAYKLADAMLSARLEGEEA